MSERLAELIVQECIKQLEIGKKCDPYTGELFTCEHNDNIDYQIKVLKEHFEMGFPEIFQTGYKQAVKDAVNLLMVQHEAAKSSHNYWHVAANLIKAELVHASDTSSERVNKTEKSEHEGWYGLTKEEVDSWELPDCPTVFEFVQFIEAKLKEKNT